MVTQETIIYRLVVRNHDFDAFLKVFGLKIHILYDTELKIADSM